MIELMAQEAILQELAKPASSTLLAYAATPQGHAHLAQLRAVTANTFVRALLQAVLVEGARAAVAQDASVLHLANVLAEEAMPVSVTPRRAPLAFTQGDTVTFFEDLLKRYKVRASEREWAVSSLNDDFEKSLVKLLTGASVTAYYWDQLFCLWDGLDSLNTGANEQRYHLKVSAAADEFLAYLYATDRVSRPFLLHTLSRSEGDWSDFVAYGQASAGVLATIALNKTISPDAWAIVVERSKDSFCDALVVAAAHPSIPEREQALVTVEAQIPYLMDKAAFYALAETLGLFPERVERHLLPAVRDTLEAAWQYSEISAWERHLVAWDVTGTRRQHIAAQDRVPALAPAPQKKKWWQAG